MWAKIITIKRTKDLNYFSLCALNLFNTRVSQFDLNYGNKWTFPRHSNLLRCTCVYIYIYIYIYILYMYMFNRRMIHIQVWNNLSKWWQTFHFWVNCVFKLLLWYLQSHWIVLVYSTRCSGLPRDKKEAARRTVQCCSAVVCTAHHQTERSEWRRQIDPWLDPEPAHAPRAPYEPVGIFYRSQHSRLTKKQRLW